MEATCRVGLSACSSSAALASRRYAAWIGLALKACVSTSTLSKHNECSRQQTSITHWDRHNNLPWSARCIELHMISVVSNGVFGTLYSTQKEHAHNNDLQHTLATNGRHLSGVGVSSQTRQMAVSHRHMQTWCCHASDASIYTRSAIYRGGFLLTSISVALFY